MKKGSIGIKTVGFGFGLICLIGFCAYLTAFVISCVNQKMLIESPFFTSDFRTIEEFKIHAVALWILFGLEMISLVGVLRLKEWGRGSLIVLNALMAIYVCYRMVFVIGHMDDLSIAIILICFCVMGFFNWDKIRMQFTAGRSHKKVLIIDDDRGLLKMLKANLDSKGLSVYTATTGEEGLQMVSKISPDLIILDVILPKLKGREVCRKLKEDERFKDIPVIFLTAKESPDDIRAEIEAGAIGHITKPLASQQLFLEIRKVLHI